MAKLRTSADVRSIKDKGRHSVGNGIYLLVSPRGTKNWSMRINQGGKKRERGLGGYPELGLREAQRKAAYFKDRVRLGFDPWLEPTLEARLAKPTFEKAARTYYSEHKPRWKPGKHRDKWLRPLEQYAFPKIGSMPVDEIRKADVLDVLKPMWAKKYETGRKTRTRMRLIFSWAIAHDYIEGFNPCGEAINAALSPPRQADRKHFASMHHKDVPAALQTIRGSNARVTTRWALEFAILTATRSSEVRFAEWSEVRFDARTWTIPGERMKAGVQHVVPLADQAVELLSKMHEATGPTGYIFVSHYRLHLMRPLSENAMSKLMRQLFGGKAVQHGFRSSFANWAHETGDFGYEAVELSLAHTVGSVTERSYFRSSLFDRRRRLMQAWADHAA